MGSSIPGTSADKELDPWQEPAGGRACACCTLKLSVEASDGLKMSTLGSESEIEVPGGWAISHTFYSFPAFGVGEN